MACQMLSLPNASPRVNRDVEVRSLDVMKRVDMFLRREAAFLASQVESDDAAVAKVAGELGHFL